MKLVFCIFFICVAAVLAVTQESPRTQSGYPLFDILRHHAIPMLLIDPESGAILDANESAVAMYGYPYLKLITMNINQINILSDREIKAEMQRAAEGKRNYFNFPHRFADGSVHIMEVFSSPIKNPQGQIFLLIVLKEKELNTETYREFERYAERLTGELATRTALYSAVRERQNIMVSVLVICILLLIIIIFNFIKSKKLASDFARSERKYKNLFMSMQEAYAYHEMVFTSQGKPVDYVFLEVNPAFESMTGLHPDAIIGKRVTEVIPGIEQEWITRYGEVVITGKPIGFELYSAPLKRWYRVSAFCPEPGKFVTIFLDISETKTLIQELNQAVAEKEMLCRELLHRIKNTLTTIGSLISLQYNSRDLPEPCKLIVSNISNQIKAYTGLYTLMHDSGTTQSINGKKYFTSIVEMLVEGFLESNMEFAYTCKLDDVALQYRTASSLGLVINELITNVFKHVLRGRQKGKLIIIGTYTDTVYEIMIADDGDGFPDGFSIEKCSNFGLSMVNQLVKQLQGEITITRALDKNLIDESSGPGSCITIRFPV